MPVLRLLNRTEEIVSSLFLATMAIIIGMQVFNRYILEDSLVWSEELGRYLFIWAVFIGCSFAAQHDRHLEVTIVKNMSGPRVKLIVTAIAHLLTLVFCGFCVVWGIQMVQLLMKTGQETPALEVSAYWIFLSLPVGMALMGLRTLQKLWQLYTDGLPDHEDIPLV